MSTSISRPVSTLPETLRYMDSVQDHVRICHYNVTTKNFSGLDARVRAIAVMIETLKGQLQTSDPKALRNFEILLLDFECLEDRVKLAVARNSLPKHESPKLPPRVSLSSGDALATAALTSEPTSTKIKIPDYFGRKQDEASFKESFRRRFPILDVSRIQRADFQRFTDARENVLEQAWQDYQTTCHALTDSALCIFMPGLSAGIAQFVLEDRFAKILAKTPTANFYWQALDENIMELDPVSSLILRWGQGYNKHHKWSDFENAAFKRSVNLPCWSLRNYNSQEHTELYGTGLTIHIANTNMDTALALIECGADVNKYASFYGNNPLTLATIKGWDHADSEGRHGVYQRPILEALLNKKELEVNAIDLRTGMTALHYACLRGDDPAFIEKLLKGELIQNLEIIMAKRHWIY